MFFYLLHNSSFIKTQKSIHKHISTLIYGSLVYIIIHAFFTCKQDNRFVNNLNKYFWIIFILDCIAVSFTFIMNDNGTLVFDNNIKFNSSDAIKEIKDDINGLNNLKKTKPNITKENMNNGYKKEVKIKERINPQINNDLKLGHVNSNQPVICKDEKNINYSNKSIDLITTKTMNKINSELDKSGYSGSDCDSINDSELGSDLDEFEKSLQKEFSTIKH